MNKIQFSRKPYTVTYYKDGEKKTIRRRPPEKAHDMLPSDVVQLNTKKNDDYAVGDEFTVKHINPRHPNIVQIQDDEGHATFVPYFELSMTEERAPRPGKLDRIDDPISNRYLLWP